MLENVNISTESTKDNQEFSLCYLQATPSLLRKLGHSYQARFKINLTEKFPI